MAKVAKKVAKKATKKVARKAIASSKKKEVAVTLHDLFVDEVKDIYRAENHLTKALPKMHKAATSDELKSAFEKHLVQTKEHVARLEKVFRLLGQKPQGKKCEAMAGLVEEASSIIADTEKGTSTRDAGIIMAAQKVEHYEIATYGSLAQLAKTLGLNEIKNILGTTLEEEKETDKQLTFVAENHVNYEATKEKENM